MLLNFNIQEVKIELNQNHYVPILDNFIPVILMCIDFNLKLYSSKWKNTNLTIRYFIHRILILLKCSGNFRTHHCIVSDLDNKLLDNLDSQHKSGNIVVNVAHIAPCRRS